MAVSILLFSAVSGLFGLLSATFLFPLCALLIRRRSLLRYTSGALRQRVAVLIPAHNEEEQIVETLSALRASLQDCPQIESHILVAADACADNTALLAEQHGASVLSWTSPRGKFHSLKALLRKVDEGTDWIVLLDSGSLLPKDFFRRICAQLSEAQLIGIAPSYRVNNAGLLFRILWSLETLLKRIEAQSGGPISVHGACCLYRKGSLEGAFDFLGEREWLNDDVVIPLTLRALFPAHQLSYRHDIRVTDLALDRPEQNYSRRQRMLKGNVEWISSLLSQFGPLDGVVSCLVLRRISRMLWGFWFLAVALPIVLFFYLWSPMVALVVTGIGALCVIRFPECRQFLEAAFVSLRLPLIAQRNRREVSWK